MGLIDPTQIIVWDIETVATLDTSLRESAEVQIREKLDAKYKRESTIESHFEEEITKLGLNSLYNQVIAFAYTLPFVGDSFQVGYAYNLNEADLMRDFISVMDHLYDIQGGLVHCGYNISGFDVPVMRMKMAKHRMKFKQAQIWPSSKYDMLDMYWDLGTPGTLDEVATALDLPTKYKNYSGKDVQNLLDKNLKSDIIEYVKQDVVIEATLARLIY